MLDRARDEVAHLLGVPGESVTFTSGATEAAHMALTLNYGPASFDRLLVGAVEHDCVLAGGRVPPERRTVLPVDGDGIVQPDAVQEVLQRHGNERCLVAVMLANNETGIIQPVAEIAEIVHAFGGALLCDVVQALGRIAVRADDLGADLMIASSHKMGGPMGAGALIRANAALRPHPLGTGGGQERRLRPGTEALPAISGFGVAARESLDHMSFAARTIRLRSRLEEGLRRATPDVVLAGSSRSRLPNTVLACLTGISAQTAVMALDLEGFEVSAGAACSSGKAARSHVLEAMGYPDASGGVRISLHPALTDSDIDSFVAAWDDVAARLRPLAA